MGVMVVNTFECVCTLLTNHQFLCILMNTYGGILMSFVVSNVGGKRDQGGEMGKGRVGVVVVKARVPCRQIRLSL